MKEVALSEKDEQLQQLHAKLHQLSTESEKERKQLQTVLAKMDKHLSTTTEELNQERLDDELKNILQPSTNLSFYMRVAHCFG